MKTIRLFTLLFVLVAFQFNTSAQTKVVESGNVGVTIPETWDSYSMDDQTSLGAGGLLIKDENAELIYFIFEFQGKMEPGFMMENSIMNNDIFKEDAKWGKIESIKYLTYDARKAYFTNKFLGAPRTGMAIVFCDGQRSYGIVIEAIPGYTFDNDPVVKTFHLLGKDFVVDHSKSTRQQIQEFIDMLESKKGTDIGNGIAWDDLILHPTKNELTFVLRIKFIGKEDIDDDALTDLDVEMKKEMINSINQMAEAFHFIQRCKDQ